MLPDAVDKYQLPYKNKTHYTITNGRRIEDLIQRRIDYTGDRAPLYVSRRARSTLKFASCHRIGGLLPTGASRQEPRDYPIRNDLTACRKEGRQSASHSLSRLLQNRVPFAAHRPAPHLYLVREHSLFP